MRITVYVPLTNSHKNNGAANTKKIWEMWLFVLPVCISMIIGTNTNENRKLKLKNERKGYLKNGKGRPKGAGSVYLPYRVWVIE